MIVCSPLNSPATNRIINQYKDFHFTKILLIDIVGNVLNYENRLYKNFNITEQNDLLVLTILTQKFRNILYNRYNVEFSRYLNMRGTHKKHHLTNESDCDLAKYNGSHYNEIVKDFATCQYAIREHCNNYSTEEIKSFCSNVTESKTRGRSKNDPPTRNNTQFFSDEHFNLFSFIASLNREEKNTSNQDRHQFDFIVLDFKSILSSSNDSIEFWRPLMVLEQSEIVRNIFTTHRAISERDVFREWLPPKLWKCNNVCWGIIATIFLILIGLVLLISISAGIGAR